jgi:hypothetical protein
MPDDNTNANNANVRHQLANAETAPGIIRDLARDAVREFAPDIARTIARDEDARAWESFGVDVTTPAGRLTYARVLDFLRSRSDKAKEIQKYHEFIGRMVLEEGKIWKALSFYEKWKDREKETEEALRWVGVTKQRIGDFGKEAGKGVWGIGLQLIAMILAAGVTSMITTALVKGGHVP